MINTSTFTESEASYRLPSPQGCPGSPCSLSPAAPRYPPLPEVPVEDAVGEAFPADADALQHTVAAQLVHDQGVVHYPCSRRGEAGGQPQDKWMLNALSRLDPCASLTGSLPFIGDDAAHKVRMSGPQVGH